MTNQEFENLGKLCDRLLAATEQSKLAYQESVSHCAEHHNRYKREKLRREFMAEQAAQGEHV